MNTGLSADFVKRFASGANQNIRDDILEINGLNPSFTRQMRGNKVTVDD